MKINCMAQDSSGILWVGSNIGLHTFDGNNFKTYYPDRNDSTAIKKGKITDILVTPSGDVLISCLPNGVNVYQPESDDFSFVDGSIINWFENGGLLKMLYYSGDSTLLLHRWSGLLNLNITSREIRPLLETYGFSDFLIHPFNKHQIFIAGNGLNLYDLSENKLQQISDIEIDLLDLDQNGIVWGLGKLERKLYSYDTSNELLKHYEIPYSMSKEEVFFINYGEEIWVNTTNGIGIFDKKLHSWKNYFNSISTPHLNNMVYALFEDVNNNVWFSQNNMLNVTNPLKQIAFNYTLLDEYDYVSGLQVAMDTLILGEFYNNEIHLYDIRGETLTILPKTVFQDSLQYLFDLEKIGNKVWLLYTNGLATMDLGTYKFNATDFGDLNKYFSDNSKKYAKYAGGFLWIRNVSFPIIARINPKTLIADTIHYKTNEDLLNQVFIQENGELLFLNNEGLNFLNFETKENKLVPYGLEFKLNAGYVRDILLVKDSVWFISEGSTYLGILKNDKFDIIENYSKESVYNYSVGYNLSRTTNGLIILFSSTGLKVFNKNLSKFIPILEEVGLSDIIKNTRISVFEDKIFLIGQGVKVLKEGDLKGTEKGPETLITRFLAGNEVIDFTKKQVLPYNKNDIRIKYRVKEINISSDIQFRYRLNKLEDYEFMDNNRNDLYFPNLKSGEYRFEISAIKDNTGWGEPTIMAFEIRQPFWRTWWFLLLTLFFTFSGITLLFWYRERNTKKFNKMRSKMVQLENEALRAQMNPHFIFNALNSIKSYIIEQEREKASDYLTDFSALIRIILSNSRMKLIPLSKELEALRLYMNIENLRVDNKFEYVINNLQKLNFHNYYIPPLTLQPFVENAIWHGFIHKSGPCKLEINISKDEQYIIFEIKDNGVGREFSNNVAISENKKRSYGLSITKERLLKHNEINEVDNFFEIVDLYDEEGLSLGTSARLKMSIIRDIDVDRDKEVKKSKGLWKK